LGEYLCWAKRGGGQSLVEKGAEGETQWVVEKRFGLKDKGLGDSPMG
jgi:hypothetical protein